MIIGLYSTMPREGKGALSEALEAAWGDGSFTISFGDILRSMVVTVAGAFLSSEEEVWEWLEDERKDKEPIPGLGVTLRYLMQTLGTEWGRQQVDPDIWVKVLDKRIEDLRFWYGYDILIIVDDMRFPNEYDYLQSQKAVLVEIKRPGAQQSDNPNHVSNAHLEGYTFDHVIENTQGIDALAAQARMILDLGEA